ncbi:MAG: hypothetical protein JWL63_3363 [Rhodocyclales bacterium]|nr:hypothetical protein [Rhodocyclales bacterium]
MVAVAMAGCSGLGPGYYWQAMSGQIEVANRTQPIEEVLEAPETTPAMRERLKLVGEIRAFASRELGLPDNESYRRYADLGRASVVWNVFATPPLSMQPKTWCLPVAGCVGYLGFFSEADARARAAELKAEGMDVLVGGVPAYSTLGWFADPVLNTFVNWPEPDLARLIFHELAHQLVYAKGDTEFNESFAVTVEQAGVRRWLTAHGKQSAIVQLERSERMSGDFAALVLKHRDALMAIYVGAGSDAEKLVRKQAQIAAMRAEYEDIKRDRWGGATGYDRWFAQDINNATFASVGFYLGLVPDLTALLNAQDGDLPRFYAKVRELAKLAPAERRVALTAVPR